MDADDPRWQEIADEVVDHLIHVSPSHVSYWQEMLLPVGAQLASALGTAFHDPQLSEIERGLATALLTDFARPRPDVLATVIQGANETQFEIFMPLLQQQSDQVTPRLESALSQQPPASWPPAEMANRLPALDPDTRRLVIATHGLVTDHVAYCQTLPMTVFNSCSAQLAACGYRPVRVRPYYVQQSLKVAAIWHRDGRPSEFFHGTAEQVREHDQQMQARQWAAVDVASFSPQQFGSADQVQFCAVWSPHNAPSQLPRLMVGLGAEQLDAYTTELENAGFHRLTALCATPIEDNSRLVSGVWQDTIDTAELFDQLGAGYDETMFPTMCQLDVCVTASQGPQGSPDQLRAAA